MAIQMSTKEVLDLPVVMDLPAAAKAFGIGRTKAFEMARDGEFPCEVLRLGRRYRVTKANLLRALGLNADGTPAPPARPSGGEGEDAKGKVA